MALQPLNAFTTKAANFADKPSPGMSAAQVKAQFDAAPEELRVFVNSLITQLNADFALKSEITNALLGQIIDGSLTPVKLSFNAETVEGSQAKANTAETNAKSASVPLTQKGANNGVPTLDSNGILVQKPYVTGIYTGDGAASKVINLGFQPSAVFVHTTDNNYESTGVYRGGFATPSASYSPSSHLVLSVYSAGFTVYYDNTYGPSTNVGTVLYNYIAFK